MKKGLMLIMVLAMGLMLAGLALAQDSATKDEVVAKCKEAAQVVKDKGPEEALKQINDKNGPFVWKDSYVFCIDLDKKTDLAHPIVPGLIGKPLMGVKDVNGKMFFAEFINVAKEKGEGWISYMWPKPGEKTPSPKQTYVYRVPDSTLVMAAGIYE